MILQDKVEVICSGRAKEHFEKLGYKLPYTKDKKGRIGVKKGTKILVDIKDIPKHSKTRIKYQCDACGKICETSYYVMFTRKNSQYRKTGKTYCPKCSPSILYKGEKSPRYKHGCALYSEYRNNAHQRGLEFHLTPDEFKNLIKQPCHYCGGFSNGRRARNKNNGVDRKDNTRGYFIDNCVPCCSTCNFIKNKMSYEEFIKYIRHLYEYTKSYKIENS